MGDLKSWREGADALRQRIAGIPDEAGTEAYTAQLREAFSARGGWEENQLIFACNYISSAALIAASREGILQWWQPLAAATYFGDLDKLRDLRAAMEEDPGKDRKPDLSTTMTWGAWDYSIVEGAPPVFNAAVLNQLFDWGADPMVKDNWGSGEPYFDKALRTSPASIIRAFLDHGAPVAHAAQLRDALIQANDYKQAIRIQEALDPGGFYNKIDDSTIAEIKYISEAGRSSLLRTIFNFGAQRVNEVFEFAGGGGTMTSCSFDDYDRAALHRAAAKLEKLGGHPELQTCPLDKPHRRHARPSGFP